MQAPPLPEGFVLEDRFRIGPVLGRGGFGVTYLAEDLERREPCVVKELLPQGVGRCASGHVNLAELGPSAAQRVRHQFMKEARVLQRINARGLLPVRAAFAANGTAYYVTPYLAGALSLDRLLIRDGPMHPDAALDVAMQLLETLEALHQSGWLHRDLKPSNVLLTPKGEAYLIDLGSARAWHTDRLVQHTVQYTPGFAPIEQMSERARRGPATDLYGLGATIYTLITGSPPPPALERMAGQVLVPITASCPEIEPRVARAIERALALRYEERPQSVAEFRDLLAARDEEPRSIGERIQLIDSALDRLARFRFARRECPACGGILETPRPLHRTVCPVCRSGRIVARRLDPRACPVCRNGVIHLVRNEEALAFCLACRLGRLRRERWTIGVRRYVCDACSARYEARGGRVRRTDEPGVETTWAQLRDEARRSRKVHVCDVCHAQFDEEEDGAWRQIHPAPRSRSQSVLMPQEWALVAADMDPAQGNAECDRCGADFFVEEAHVTLLDAVEDPFRFAAEHAGRRFGWEDVAWVAIGKTSGEPGLVCGDCRCEFDGVDDPITLVSSPRPVLRAHVGESHPLVDWHRIARDLPLVGEEDVLDRELAELLRAGFRAGEISLDSRRPEIIWQGLAAAIEPDDRGGWREGARATLRIEADTIFWGGRLRRSRRLITDLRLVDAQEDRLYLEWDDEAWRLNIDPIQLEAKLSHSRAGIELHAEDLMHRLNFDRATMPQRRTR